MCKQHHGENWLQQQQCCQHSIKHRINRTAESMPKCCCLGEWLCIRKDPKSQQQCLQRGGSRAVGPNGLYKRLSRPTSYRKGRKCRWYMYRVGGLPSPSSPALIETLSQVGHRRAGTPWPVQACRYTAGLAAQADRYIFAWASQSGVPVQKSARPVLQPCSSNAACAIHPPPHSDTPPKNTFSAFEYFIQFLCMRYVALFLALTVPT